jgi:hypothetical protein
MMRPPAIDRPDDWRESIFLMAARAAIKIVGRLNRSAIVAIGFGSSGGAMGRWSWHC